MARPFVSEIKEHDTVRGQFLVTRRSLLQTKGGQPYLSITLGDRTGELEGRVWDDAARLHQLLEHATHVEVDAVAQVYAGRMQLKIDRLHPLDASTLDARDFVVASRFDPALMWRELVAHVDGVGDEWIRRLLQAFLDDPEIGARLRRAPAAKAVHHAFAAGLLEHTLSVVQLAHRIADHYPRADRDLLVAGAILHDIGKTAELSYDAGIDYTTEGRLVGHLVMTAQWIERKAAEIPGFPPPLKVHLTHLVAAHHGQLDFGSPKVPQTLEAMLVHALDELDSRVQSWTAIMDRDKGEEWTEYQRLYDRFLYKGPGWGRERAGYGPSPAPQRWSGESLYRREAEGSLDETPEAATEEPPTPRRAARREPKSQQAPQPDIFELFGRPAPK